MRDRAFRRFQELKKKKWVQRVFSRWRSLDEAKSDTCHILLKTVLVIYVAILASIGKKKQCKRKEQIFTNTNNARVMQLVDVLHSK